MDLQIDQPEKIEKYYQKLQFINQILDKCFLSPTIRDFSI